MSIASPASGQSVSGTASVQVSASDDSGIAKIVLLARGKGSSVEGVSLGSAAVEPYVVSVFTPRLPNQAEIEWIAEAEDGTGHKAKSEPIWVKTSNTGVPTLNYLAAFTLPPKPSTQGTRDKGQEAEIKVDKALANQILPFGFDGSKVLPPRGVDLLNGPPAISHQPSAKASRPSTLDLAHSANPRPLRQDSGQASTVQPQADPVRTYALEWGWGSVPAVDGYGVYISKGDLAGPYELQVKQAAATNGGQAFSKNVKDARPGDTFFGAVTPLTGGGSAEGGMSNADTATFLPLQEAEAPGQDAPIADGRPSLRWKTNDKAVGYLFYVFDKNPWDNTAKLQWSNFPQSTDQISATFPSDKDKLKSGSYFWWVAGVGFNNQGQADSFSFSDPLRFVVP